MDRPKLRPLPNLAPPAGRVPAITEAEDPNVNELAGVFGELLTRGRSEEESPSYELLEAAVDGTLDTVEAELFASRLAGDPVLQREFDDLQALRDQLRQRTGTVRTDRPTAVREPAHRHWMGVAAAALVLIAAGVGLRLDLRQRATGAAEVRRAPAATEQAHEVVFVDSFEGGTTGHWSN